MRRALAMIAALGSLLSLFGCSHGLSNADKLQMGQAALSEAAAQIPNAEATDVRFQLSGPVQEPMIVLKLTADTTDPEVAKQVLIDGQKAAIKTMDAIGESSSLVRLLVTDTDGTQYDATDIGFDTQYPGGSRLRERYR